MSDIPEIRIDYSFLLAGFESRILAEKFNLEMDSDEQYIQWTQNYRTEWKKYEDKIISALQEAIGVKFYRDVIDVSCAPFFRPHSDPLILSYKQRPDQFVDELTHELCHVLLNDNNKYQSRSGNKSIDLIEIWTDLFGSHEISLLAHIPVQALMMHIYLDILKEPNRLDRDKKDSLNYSPKHGNAYTGSWAYVEEHGYKEIIAKLKKSYEEMPA